MKDNIDDELMALEESLGQTLVVEKSPKFKDTKRKKLDTARKTRGFTDIKGKVKNLRTKYSPSKTLLINMELRNGHHTSFVVYPDKDFFIYRKGKYIIDESLRYYNIDAEMHCLDYHEDLAIPIRRKIPVGDIRKIISSSGISDVETAINPGLLMNFQTSSVIEQALKGQEIDEAIKQLRLIAIIGAIGGVGSLLFLIWKSGVLQGVIG